MSEDKWGWMLDGDETASGPFDTREDAIIDAQEQCHPDDIREVLVGKILFADAKKYTPDLDTFMENLEERAYDDFAFVEDVVFTLSKEAEKAYDKAIKAFLKEHVFSSYWCLGARNTETIQIEGTDDVV